MNRPPKFANPKLKGTRWPTFGTGKLVEHPSIIASRPHQPCPLKNCPYSTTPHEVSASFLIRTACHVVFDEEEVKNTTVEFFYHDQDDRSSVVKAEGVSLVHSDPDGDTATFLAVTHDLTLMDLLSSKRKRTFPEIPVGELPGGGSPPFSYCVSHPHGAAKHVTFGSVEEMEEDHMETVSESVIERCRLYHKHSGYTERQYFYVRANITIESYISGGGAAFLAAHRVSGTDLRDHVMDDLEEQGLVECPPTLTLDFLTQFGGIDEHARKKINNYTKLSKLKRTNKYSATSHTSSHSQSDTCPDRGGESCTEREETGQFGNGFSDRHKSFWERFKHVLNVNMALLRNLPPPKTSKTYANMTYTVDTCPGSSGATVIMFSVKDGDIVITSAPQSVGLKSKLNKSGGVTSFSL